MAAPVIPDQRSEEHADTWSLVDAAQTGDRDAFGQLYERYVGVVFRYIRGRVPDRHLVEDFTSETFLRALRRIESVQYQGRDVGAWLVTIARNIVTDHFKSSRTRLEWSWEQPGLAVEQYLPSMAAGWLQLRITRNEWVHLGESSDGVDPAERVFAQRAAEALVQALGVLTPEQREVVLQRFWAGLTSEQVAEAMGRNAGAVKALQHRAVLRLGKVEQLQQWMGV